MLQQLKFVLGCEWNQGVKILLARKNLLGLIQINCQERVEITYRARL